VLQDGVLSRRLEREPALLHGAQGGQFEVKPGADTVVEIEIPDDLALWRVQVRYANGRPCWGAFCDFMLQGAEVCAQKPLPLGGSPYVFLPRGNMLMDVRSRGCLTKRVVLDMQPALSVQQASAELQWDSR
jgi:hypothetical protein